MESARPGRVLVVDDDEALCRALSRVLASTGHEVHQAVSAAEALALLERIDFDVVVSDVHMPGSSGIELLQHVSRAKVDLPVVLLTAGPSVDSAVRAVTYGGFRYLVKPVPVQVLETTVREALGARRLARARGEARARAELDQAFHAALRSMWIAARPVAAVRSKDLFGYELFVRTAEPSLPDSDRMVDAASKLGALHLFGRTMRQAVANLLDGGPRNATYFVRLHATDLADLDLYDRKSPLGRHARRIVLQIAERDAVDNIDDPGRLFVLKALDYRIAIRDLGAGIAGLGYLGAVRPDFVTIDDSLVRGVDTDRSKQKFVSALATVARELGVAVVAEGVEKRGERDALIRLGCAYLHGDAVGDSGRAFPEMRWDP
jgi:EAL domain-containing protein (putative c-di-GMP-specific phosphodiesterase class I)